MAAGVDEQSRVAGLDQYRRDARPVGVGAAPPVDEQDGDLGTVAHHGVGDRRPVRGRDEAVLRKAGVLLGGRHTTIFAGSGWGQFRTKMEE